MFDGHNGPQRAKMFLSDGYKGSKGTLLDGHKRSKYAWYIFSIRYRYDVHLRGVDRTAAKGPPNYRDVSREIADNTGHTAQNQQTRNIHTRDSPPPPPPGPQPPPRFPVNLQQFLTEESCSHPPVLRPRVNMFWTMCNKSKPPGLVWSVVAAPSERWRIGGRDLGISRRR